MKKYSLGALIFQGIGLLLFLVNAFSSNYQEWRFLVGVVAIIVGAILGFMAIAKRELGGTKFVSIFIFFAVWIYIALVDPFQVVRVLTWLKNIA